ncbi:PepSY domain-containing protein [Novosphingobium sp. MW5]|nr:PepSY domain-containing protein [Novosphingobium sp. MW5]
MRKWHRWLSVFFGVFLLWIAVTGVLSQVPIWQEQFGGKDEAAEQAAAKAAIPAGFKCPETMICRPKKPQTGGLNVGLIHHLHSGETFGPLGTVIATLSGLAMVFFSFSGLWLYISMWRNRKNRALKPGWFWK